MQSITKPLKAVLAHGPCFRYFHWYLSLYLMLFMVIILIPFYLVYFFLSQSQKVPAHYVTPLAFVTWLA